jgi:hypothetical protein
MLPLAITIGPDAESLAILGLLFDVVGDIGLVLQNDINI